MFRLSLLLPTALALCSNFATAQNPQADQQTYCTYLTEQAKAQSDLLRSPTAMGGFTQPDTGLPTQLIAGAQLSLSNLKRAGITLDAARKNCELYNTSTAVQTALQYALPALEKDALTHRLALIQQASESLNALIDRTAKMVAAQNMTRPMLLGLLTNRIKLEADRAQTESSLAAIYVPPLVGDPLKQQVAAKQSSDLAEQTALARLTRQNNWDIALTVGAHQQIDPVAHGTQPYGEVSLSYNLASRAIDKHLDRSVQAYDDWKKVEESDVVRGIEVLKSQIQQAIAAQKGRLQTLQSEQQELEKNRQLVADPQTSSALDFSNQLISTQLLLEIESGDASYRLDRLKDFLSRNF
jgi:hypothetical protein